MFELETFRVEVEPPEAFEGGTERITLEIS